MARIVRRDEDLLAIRLGLEMSRNGMRCVAEPFRGEGALSTPVTLPLSQLGYVDQRERRSTRMHFLNATGALPAAFAAVFEEANSQAEPGEPLWLQIAYGADVLGAYPWEDVVPSIIQRPLLRVPNFARNTYRPDQEGPMAIIAAAPKAKGGPGWEHQLSQLLSGLPTDFGREVVLYLSNEYGHPPFFADALLGAGAHLDLRFAEPPAPGAAPARERGIAQQDKIINPWLHWVIDDMAAQGVDRVHAVHVLCTGYGQGQNGAVALPESPTADTDTAWARFVGVQEYALFCDALDCQIAGFTGIGAPIWQEGLRLLANELSWKRLGPIIADFSEEGVEAARAYRALLTEQGLGDEPACGLIFSVHPKAVSEVEEAAAFRAIAAGRGQVDFSAELTLMEAYSRTPPEDLPPQVQRTLDRLSSARPRSLERQARDRGALRAMQFLAKIKAAETD